MEASSYKWPESEFHRDGKGVLLNVKDLGWYGGGTVTLDFLLGQDPHTDALTLTVEFTMHYTSLMQLTALKGIATLQAATPTLTFTLTE